MTLTVESRDVLLRAVALFESRVAAAASDAWSQASPCEGWSARDVVAHVVANLRALRATADGADFFSAFGQPVDGNVLDAWRAERDGVSDTLGTLIERSTETILVGGNHVPPFVVVDGLMRDLVIHSWDLARAVGGDERLPDELISAATEAMKMVTDEARGPGLYGYPVAVADGADAQAKLLASSGRRS
ncbi:MAG: TIGR03086 family metal-binding protein [Acidimicrobiia bacterium]